MSKPQEESITENPEVSITTMPELPEETIKELMFLVPVKSLLKFRCVSPSWLSFIDSPYFVNTYMSKSTPKIILNPCDADEDFYTLDINPHNPKPKAETSVLKLCYPHATTFILGSCNGVLLSQHNNTRPEMMFSRVFVPHALRWDIVLQNPSTRTLYKIPFVEHEYPGPKHAVSRPEKFIYGLGYDTLTDDYKVFRNCQFYGCSGDGKPFYSQVHVYSLKMKSYKQIQPFPYYMKYGMGTESVFVGGALHWVVNPVPFDESEGIASFDVATEEYRLVDQPAYFRGSFVVSVLGECLCVVCSYNKPLENKEVWVMKEYGNVESWSKVISIRPTDIGVEKFGYFKPLFNSEDGKQLLLQTDISILLWYDLENKSVESVELCHRKPEQFVAIVHLESLVKLGFPAPDPDEKSRAKENDEKPNKMQRKRDDFLSKGFKLKL